MSARGDAPFRGIATPALPGRLPGVRMAGFRGLAGDLFDFQFVPHPAVTLFIDFGDGLLVDETRGREWRGSIAVGLAPRGVRGHSQDIECLQVRVSPLVAYSVLDGCTEIGGTVAALDELWGRDTARFQGLLNAATSWHERFEMAETAIARLLETGRAVDPEVAFAWGRMVRQRGRVRVAELAAEAGWSRKRLWSRFRAQVGLTPKRAAQLVRFDHAAHRLAAGHSPARVAADSGYVDQSHLHHEVMAFTGMTPTALATTPWLGIDDVAWPVPAPPGRRGLGAGLGGLGRSE